LRDTPCFETLHSILPSLKNLKCHAGGAAYYDSIFLRYPPHVWHRRINCVAGLEKLTLMVQTPFLGVAAAVCYAVTEGAGDALQQLRIEVRGGRFRTPSGPVREEDECIVFTHLRIKELKTERPNVLCIVEFLR
jgi:hypothetical protein